MFNALLTSVNNESTLIPKIILQWLVCMLDFTRVSMQVFNIAIFGIIAVSLHVKPVNVFFFFVIYFSCNLSTFHDLDFNILPLGHCVIYQFLGRKVTAPSLLSKSEDARTPMLLVRSGSRNKP